ncbi:MAG TPA: outer membrane lipoprotein carrier protein LolA [Burkholderiales bacterium]|nr:outer membrane lipoprotein carrier protein LolA [Burkholderiales bacterium]
MRRVAIALLLAACHLPGAAQEAFSLPALMQALAAVPVAQARFTEVRHLRLLRAPLELQGTLRYVRPDRLERRVQSPYEETIVIEGNRVSVDDPARGERRSYALASLPAAYAMVESLRATLAGDLVALERHYEVRLAGGREAWTLSLTPRDAGGAGLLTEVRLQGAAARITRIEYLEAAGDRTTVTIRELQP